jgi:hypothetical protein
VNLEPVFVKKSSNVSKNNEVFLKANCKINFIMFCKIEFRIEINSQYLPDIDWPFAREFIIHKVENRIINKIEKIYRKTVET